MAKAPLTNPTAPSKYSYNFRWLGRPIIQYPQDMVAVQDLIWRVRPDVIIETGIAHGGSLVLSASMLALLDMVEAIEMGATMDPRVSQRRVIGVDIDIRAHNRAAIETHPMASRIRMIEGSSIDPTTIARVKAEAAGAGRVMVCLDSMHTHDHVLAELREHSGQLTRQTRLELAGQAFKVIRRYDSAIETYFDFLSGDVFNQVKDGSWHDERDIRSKLKQELRYGENPHQSAAFYKESDAPAGAIAAYTQVQGKELSYNNIADADAAWECVKSFDTPACVIVKHANPCGVATADTLLEAYQAALACDSVSAFGGIIAVNRPLDAETAEAMAGIFTEVVAAPDASDEAKAVFARKKNLRLLLTGELPDPAREGLSLKTIAGGYLVQSRDNGQITREMLKTVTRRAPTAQELADCLFAWTVAKHVKSNAIVYAAEHQLVGVGAGQMSRVDSVKLGASKAQLPLTGTVLASDAFFPFRDGLDEAAKHGITAVIQPGGSVRDKEVIEAANEHGIAMVFAGMRHFKH